MEILSIQGRTDELVHLHFVGCCWICCNVTIIQDSALLNVFFSPIYAWNAFMSYCLVPPNSTVKRSTLVIKDWSLTAQSSLVTLTQCWSAAVGWKLHLSCVLSLLQRLSDPVQTFLPQQINSDKKPNTIRNHLESFHCWIWRYCEWWERWGETWCDGFLLIVQRARYFFIQMAKRVFEDSGNFFRAVVSCVKWPSGNPTFSSVMR